MQDKTPYVVLSKGESLPRLDGAIHTTVIS